MKKKLYLCLVIFLITMPTIITMNCVKDGFMCQFAQNCCNKLCNEFGFCHRGYQAKPIQFNPAIFDLPPNPVPSPPNPGMFNNYPNGPWGFPGNNNPNGPWGYPGNNNPNGPWGYPGNNNPNGPWIPPVNNNPNGPWIPPVNSNGPWNPSTVNPLGNPPPNANLPADVYNDKPDSNPLRLHHF